MNPITDDTKNVVNTLQAYSENGLRKENDFGQILEFCVSNSNFDVIQRFLSAGNALTKLARKLGDTNLPEDAILLVQREFKDQLERFQLLLKFVSDSGWNSEFSKRLNQIYLEESKGGVLNIIDLSSDFALFKTMQAEHRETQSGS